MPRVEVAAPPLPNNPIKFPAGESPSPLSAHQRSGTQSTLSIGTMSDGSNGSAGGGDVGAGPDPASSSAGTRAGTSIDEESPRSAVTQQAENGSNGRNVSNGTQETRPPSKDKTHGRSLSSDDVMQRRLMAMQQEQMMMQQQMAQMNPNVAAGVPPTPTPTQQPPVRRHSHSDEQERRSHRRGNSHSGDADGRRRHRSSGKSRKSRSRSYDAEYYQSQLLYIQQQQQMLAYQQAQYYGAPAPAPSQPFPPYRPSSNGSTPSPDKASSRGGPGLPLAAMTNQQELVNSAPPKASQSSSSSRRKKTRNKKSVSAPAGADPFGGAVLQPPYAGNNYSPTTGYGSMDSRLQQQQQHQPRGGPITPSAHFSPRKELMALAGQQMSSKTSPTSGATGSPGNFYAQGISPNGGLSPGSVLVPLGVAANRGRTQSWTSGDGRGGPPLTRLSPLRESRPLTQQDLALAAQLPLTSTGRGVYEAPPSETDAFLPENFGHHTSSSRKHRHHSSHKRSASTHRKMHMRQHSVELFMDTAKGVEQPRRCRDVFFALLFYVQLGGMIYLGIRFGKDALRPGAVGVKKDEMRTDEIITTYHNFIVVACMCGAFAVAMSALALLIMMAISRRLVQVALIFSIGMAFAWGTIGIGLSPKSFVPITGIIALALSIGYTFVVYDRIPFATSNLRTALAGIRDNLGLVGVAFLAQAITLAMSIDYTIAGVGLSDAILFGDLHLPRWGNILAYVGVGLAYFWTYQVLCHVVQVTVAGVIGSWWFVNGAEPTSPCSDDLLKSFSKSSSLSFGSICFGSLFVGFVQILRQFVEPMRPNRDGGVLMFLQEIIVCFQECVVSCVDRLADSFNPWAFTYVGLYGYGFLEAGRHATELFRRRGWSMIVTDDLIPNVLFMVSLVIGGATGCFAVLIEVLDDYRFLSMGQSSAAAFGLGLVIGLILSSVLFGLISSAVNAVIVCFAGSPVEFQQNHPTLSDEMRSAWREVWPGSLDIADMTMDIENASGRRLFPTTPQ